jgi:hypothetical protein
MDTGSPAENASAQHAGASLLIQSEAKLQPDSVKVVMTAAVLRRSFQKGRRRRGETAGAVDK